MATEERGHVAARMFLRMLLADRNYAPDEIRELASEEGFSWRTVERARASLGIKSIRKGFPAKVIAWVLPPSMHKLSLEERLLHARGLVSRLTGQLKTTEDKVTALEALEKLRKKHC